MRPRGLTGSGEGAAGCAGANSAGSPKPSKGVISCILMLTFLLSGSIRGDDSSVAQRLNQIFVRADQFGEERIAFVERERGVEQKLDLADAEHELAIVLGGGVD